MEFRQYTHDKGREYAEQYLSEIKEFYSFLTNSITPEDYELLQSEFGYEESYEDHIESLSKDIPDDETTIQQIEIFLNTYVVFQDDIYVGMIRQLNKKLSNSDSEQSCKHNAYLLMRDLDKHDKASAQDTTVHPDDLESNLNTDDVLARQENAENGLIRVQLGSSIITLETHHNPLLSSLYSILMSIFSVMEYGKEPKHM